MEGRKQLIDYFNEELGYLHELGGEFAEEHPKVAARLGMRGIEVKDPYVERLLEGVAFLAARVRLKMDAEFPRFSQRLLEVVYPGYAAPTPSAAIVRLDPKLAEASLAAGYRVPRGTVLRGQIPAGEQTACEFQTAHDVMLWPLEVVEAALTGATPDLPVARYPTDRPVRGVLRIRLRSTGGLTLEQLSLERLTWFLSGSEEVPARLHELLLARVLGIIVCGPERPVKQCSFLPSSAMVPEGFAEEQALFPRQARSFQGYRLLQEYFAFPERYHFVSVTGLAPITKAIAGDTLDIAILLDRSVPELERVVDAQQFSLFCTPAVNLFRRRSDRLQVLPDQFEHHVVMDRVRPRDFEVYSITEVLGHSAGETDPKSFRPFYGSLAADAGSFGRYYTARREPRLVSDHARREGTRTDYLGSEVFLSLVDQAEAPYRADLRQLTVDALCTNRDLPVLMPLGGRTDLTLTTSAPVESVRVIRGPSRPRAAVAERDATWKLISHLGLNYLTLTDVDDREGASAVQRLLGLYATDDQSRRQVEGVQRLAVRPVTRRIPRPGPLVFGRGVELTVTLDETVFAGAGGFLLGMVLEHFFARHVGLNSFTETVVLSLQRGEIARWTPRPGERAVA
ncbi:MAG: type VI secretion system baseplate subunit TssF [Pseudomonadota bacterium]|nr:type VI secretion system baseplate subunit TssF [Pseudomonadota bacterium]